MNNLYERSLEMQNMRLNKYKRRKAEAFEEFENVVMFAPADELKRLGAEIDYCLKKIDETREKIKRIKERSKVA